MLRKLDNGLSSARQNVEEKYEDSDAEPKDTDTNAKDGTFGKKLNAAMNKKYPVKKSQRYKEYR